MCLKEIVLLIGCCHCFFVRTHILHYISGLFIDSFMVLTVYDTNYRRSYSCAMFKYPDIIIRELCYCGTSLSTLIKLLWKCIPVCSQQVT